MLNQRTALRLAEAAAKWLATRDLRQWLNQAIVVTTEAGKHFVCPREQALALLDKAREKAVAKGLPDLERDIAAGIDVVKGTAPIDVPVVVFLERDGGEVEMGVFTLALPMKAKAQA